MHFVFLCFSFNIALIFFFFLQKPFSSVLLLQHLLLMCCHVAPPTGQQEGDRLAYRWTLWAAETLVVGWKSNRKAERLSVMNRESPARCSFLWDGERKYSVHRRALHTLRFRLCSGCAELFTRVFKGLLGGISTLALRSRRSSRSGLQKLGILQWNGVHTDSSNWRVIRKNEQKSFDKKGMVEGVLLNALGVCFNLVLGSRCTFLWDCSKVKAFLSQTPKAPSYF